MLNVRKCLFTVSPLKNLVFFSSKRPNSKTQVRKKGGQEKKAPFHRGFMFGHNPGVQAQISALDMSEQEMKDPNLLDDLEQQFWNADKVLDDIDREEHIHDELLSIYQVTRKQFKEEKSPNMLLWDEKQEIKALHAQDPEKWTVMKLAFSYPATPSIITKVIKSNWKIKSLEEIDKHDERVRRNWQALSKGLLDVPNKELKKHLLSFTNRSKMQTSNNKEISTQVSTSVRLDPLKTILKDGGVFANIYNSYTQLKQKPIKTNHADTEEVEEGAIEQGLKELYQPPQNDTFVIPRSAQNVTLRTRNLLTLEEMKGRVLQDFERGKILAKDEKDFVNEQLLLKKQNSTFNQLKDPIGFSKKPELSEYQNYARESSSNGELYVVKQNELPVRETNSIVNVDHHKSSVTHAQEEDEIASKYIDVEKVNRTQDREDKELLASLRTARAARSAADNENMVKVVKSYVSQSSESYPLEIAIPKDKWKKGNLYRVKDRFYTDDGEFLFRVPGLSRE